MKTKYFYLEIEESLSLEEIENLIKKYKLKRETLSIKGIGRVTIEGNEEYCSEAEGLLEISAEFEDEEEK